MSAKKSRTCSPDFTLWMVYQYTQSLLGTGVLPNSVAEKKGTPQGFHHEDNGDLKTVREFNGCDRRKLRLDQQHCSYNPNLNDRVKKGSLYIIKIFQSMHPVCNEKLTLSWIQSPMSGPNPTQHITTIHIFRHGGGCIMLWVCLSSVKTREFFRI